jgi:ribosome-binding ATPase YchF (GTP1/OBG family)
MSLQIGIVGLPNVGKSTLFNALTQAGAAVASYPFTTIDPNVGVVEVPDPRLRNVAAIVRPQEVKPTIIQFVDIAGLVKGAHQGEGLGNQFLGHIRNVDAVAMVVRCFEDPDVAHLSAELDPLDDSDIVDLELVLADLATVERREAKVQSMAKAQPREFTAELQLLARVKAHLEGGHLAALLSLSDQEIEILRPLSLLTGKPRLYVANVSEDDLPDGPPDEAAEYRSELGLEAPGLERLIHAGYQLLDLITFFTATGTNVVRAWTLRRGQTAYEAAGKVHTDMQQGFIRAEVVSYDDLMTAGDPQTARQRGLVRMEGREYVVQDGDILHIRFSPPS